ncbi:uncharacterized protein [Spinacia oleracea]|uniref:Uncharacterized protein isoform X2 n=1 Tax=Spinacia oleracea TaxID=3562 RepID=A0ABM3RCI9_SPIOL|nr:uncharacterized protein LOC110801404 isoform X2 [Spinacia oleracea]
MSFRFLLIPNKSSNTQIGENLTNYGVNEDEYFGDTAVCLITPTFQHTAKVASLAGGFVKHSLVEISLYCCDLCSRSLSQAGQLSAQGHIARMLIPEAEPRLRFNFCIYEAVKHDPWMQE